jgi:hypothetical protein
MTVRVRHSQACPLELLLTHLRFTGVKGLIVSCVGLGVGHPEIGVGNFDMCWIS